MENGKAQAANFPFCTIEPNVGVVAVPDERLQVLSDLGRSQRIVPTAVEFVDIAGLVKGASEGEVRGEQAGGWGWVWETLNGLLTQTLDMPYP